MEDAVVAWLLDGDPAVLWQVHRDLLDADAKVVDRERAAVQSHGWGARLLAVQSPDGSWGGGLYSPKWTSTTYTLLLLRQLGLPPDNPAARRGCVRLLDGASRYDGGLTFSRSARVPETCITALVLSTVAAFDALDPRADAAMGWLLSQQLPDGGWNCETVRRGSRHGSFHTSILALEALHEWRRVRSADRAVARAAEDGRRFFAEHRVYCSHRTGEPVDAALTRMVFPPGWHHDVLRGLDHFQAVAAPADERLADAVGLLRRRRRTDGTWRAYAPYAGRYWFPLEPPGGPSRINTLRALRVLRWWDGLRPPPSTPE